MGTFLLYYTDVCLPGKEADRKGGEVLWLQPTFALSPVQAPPAGVDLLEGLQNGLCIGKVLSGRGEDAPSVSLDGLGKELLIIVWAARFADVRVIPATQYAEGGGSLVARSLKPAG